MLKLYLRRAAFLVIGAPLMACAATVEECRYNEKAVEIPKYEKLGFSVVKEAPLEFKLEGPGEDIIEVQFYACEHFGFDAEVKTKSDIKTAENVTNKLQLLGLATGLSSKTQRQLIGEIIDSEQINEFLNNKSDEAVGFVLLDGVEKYQFYVKTVEGSAIIGLYYSD